MYEIPRMIERRNRLQKRGINIINILILLPVIVGQGFKPVTLPHKPLLFLNASIKASRKALFLGIGPSNWLYDISTFVKLDISSKEDGMDPEREL